VEAVTLAQDWIDAKRNERYRRRMDLRITEIEQGEKLIDELGFAFFWPIKGIEAPSLFDAIAGRVRALSSEHDDPDISTSWGWKDQSLGGTRWYYSKLLRRRATLIAPRLWAAFYALTPNYGDLEDYLELVQDGTMTHEARLIYEALLEHGSLNTVELRRKVGMTANSSKTRFERGLTELQVWMKILPVGVAEAGAWNYSFAYDLTLRHYPELPIQAKEISTAQAWEALVGQYVENAIAVTQKQIGQLFHVFEPTPREIERALKTLEGQGRVQAGSRSRRGVGVAPRADQA
jgi:hypothetical protein